VFVFVVVREVMGHVLLFLTTKDKQGRSSGSLMRRDLGLLLYFCLCRKVKGVKWDMCCSHDECQAKKKW